MTNKYKATIHGFPAVLYSTDYTPNHVRVTLLYNNRHEHNTLGSHDEAIAWAVELLGNATKTVPTFTQVKLEQD